ncbi:MAG: RDD family protein [Bacteroidota bacterium]|nr:RDD family protein [Bacteroidota bacterium]
MNEVGVGSRVINFLVDTILIALIAYGLYKWNSFYVYYWHHKFYPFYLFFYPMIFVYYTIFEAIFSRSPGKWLSITKVQNLKGQKPAFYLVLLRSLLRLTLIDMFFIPLFNRPLHDQLSKTRVVEA